MLKLCKNKLHPKDQGSLGIVVLGPAVTHARPDSPQGFPKHLQSERGGPKAQNKPRRVCNVPTWKEAFQLLSTAPCHALVRLRPPQVTRRQHLQGQVWVETCLIVLKAIFPSYAYHSVLEEVVALPQWLQGLNETVHTKHVAQWRSCDYTFREYFC